MLKGAESVVPEKIRKRKKFVPNYDVEGVRKIILSEETQLGVEISVGQYVTLENPWKMVKKDLILDNLEIKGDHSEFFPLQKEIMENPDKELLMGYILDESRDEDEFYLCWTPEATKHCWEQKERFLKRQARKLGKSVFRKIKQWNSLGSEKEIDSWKPKNSRPLIEVEFNSRFPCALEPESFTVRNIDDVRDGYLSLTPYREKYTNVLRKRVDIAIQAAPEKKCSFAQTVLRYPKNAWTQSRIFTEDTDEKVEKDSELSTEQSSTGCGAEDGADEEQDMEDKPQKKKAEQSGRTIEAFMNEKLPFMLEYLKFNAKFDVYHSDYNDLLVCQSPEGEYHDLNFGEYLVFTDIRAKGKCVAAAEWHPMWTGIIAIAYADAAVNTIKKKIVGKDEVHRAVFGLNPVLIWSHLDSLRPKLYLESSTEVITLSFCPWNEFILIGGCTNGQVIIWDLKDKLDKVEVEELLTEGQQRYRIIVNSRMKWMKNIHDKSIVSPAAMSNLLYSHNASIQEINWLSPNYLISKTGQMKILPEEAQRSLIFTTCSIDGTLLIWNLSPSVLNVVDAKLARKSKRVLKRPEGLTSESSDFDVFDRILQPIYKVILGRAGLPQAVPAVSVSMNPPIIKYHGQAVKLKKGRKYYYCSLMTEPEGYINTSCYIGSALGEVLKVSWEGHNFNTGEVINSEYCDIKSRVRIHDGPVVACLINPFVRNITLTAGGKVFAIWSDRLPEQPIFWKRKRYNITHVCWSSFKASVYFITNSEGCLEIWDLLYRSDVPICIKNFTGNGLTGLYMHKLPLERNIIGMADHRGSVKFFFLPAAFTHYCPDTSCLEDFIDREVNLRTFLRIWQTAWNKINLADVEKRREMEYANEKAKEDEAKSREEEEIRKREAAEEAARIERDRVIGPEERWDRLMMKLVEKTIAAKKQLNKEELLRQEAPLRNLERYRQEKIRKQVDVLKNQKSIFEETVAILFPEAAPKPPKKVKTLAPSERQALKTQYMDDYNEISRIAKQTVNDNRFKYRFDWGSTLGDGKDRARSLDKYGFYLGLHKQRWRDDPVLHSEKKNDPPPLEAIAPEIVANLSGNIQVSFDIPETEETET